MILCFVNIWFYSLCGPFQTEHLFPLVWEILLHYFFNNFFLYFFSILFSWSLYFFICWLCWAGWYLLLHIFHSFLLPFLGNFFSFICWTFYHVFISAILVLASTRYFFFSAYSILIASYNIFSYITENIYDTSVVVLFPCIVFISFDFLKKVSQFWSFIFTLTTFLNYLVIVGFLITFKMRHWEADWRLEHEWGSPFVGFTAKQHIKAFPWRIPQCWHLHGFFFSLGLIRFSREYIFWFLTWSVETRILKTVWIKVWWRRWGVSSVLHVTIYLTLFRAGKQRKSVN